MVNVSLFGDTELVVSSASQRRCIAAVKLAGDLEIDLRSVDQAAHISVLALDLAGDVRVRVRLDQKVTFSGITLFGDRKMEEGATLADAPDQEVKVAVILAFGDVLVIR